MQTKNLEVGVEYVMQRRPNRPLCRIRLLSTSKTDFRRSQSGKHFATLPCEIFEPKDRYLASLIPTSRITVEHLRTDRWVKMFGGIKPSEIVGRYEGELAARWTAENTAATEAGYKMIAARETAETLTRSFAQAGVEISAGTKSVTLSHADAQAILVKLAKLEALESEFGSDLLTEIG